MKGRNKRDGSRRSTQQARRSAREAEAGAKDSWGETTVSDTFHMNSTTFELSPCSEPVSLMQMPPATAFGPSALIHFPHLFGQMSEEILRQGLCL